jgi:toxin ParE1/3/4
MAEFRLAASAEAQLVDILDYSAATFGDDARERYAKLLVRAMQDVAEDPDKPTVSWKQTLVGRVGVYHVRNSRHRVPTPPGPVLEPRHFLVFQVGKDDIVDILGFIHERMLFNRALNRIARPGDNTPET